MDKTGFETMFVNKLENTSCKAPGAGSFAASKRSSFTGNKKLPTTASNAAMKVLSKYLDTTVLKREPRPPPALATDDMTSNATKMGAIAFKELTKT